MSISDRLAARLRTVWPMLLGWLAAWLLAAGAPIRAWLAATLGVDVTQAQVVAVLGIALGWLVYELGRWLEARSGVGRLAAAARLAGRWLLSVGLAVGPPVYGQPPAEHTSETDLDEAGNIRTIRSVTTWPAPPADRA